jgi:hypothetical protein
LKPFAQKLNPFVKTFVKRHTLVVTNASKFVKMDLVSNVNRDVVPNDLVDIYARKLAMVILCAHRLLVNYRYRYAAVVAIELL